MRRLLRWASIASALVFCLADGPAGSGGVSGPADPLIVGYAPGGNTDIPARLFANAMSKILGVSIVVENRPGASGVPAAEYVKRAKPDGYTLLWATSASHSVAVVAMAPLSYDPVKDFAPVTLISMTPTSSSAATSSRPRRPGADRLSEGASAPAVGNAGPATSGRFATEL